MLLIGSKALAHNIHYITRDCFKKKSSALNSFSQDYVKERSAEGSDYDILISKQGLAELFEKILVVKNKDIISEVEEKPYGVSCLMDSPYYHGKKERYEFYYTDENESDKQIYEKYAKGSYELWVPNLGFCYVAPLEVLYSIKLSHIYYHDNYPHRFIKHAKDIAFMRDYLEKDRLFNLTKLRRKDMEKYRGLLKAPTLNGRSKEDFFNDNVVKYFVHDEIHEVVAHEEKPMYTRIQKEGAEVECTKELWEKLSDRQKAQCVLEESYVIACERLLIPMIMGASKKFVTPQNAWEWAYMRIGTTLCKGWFRAWAARNYDSIIAEYNPEYWKIVFEAIMEGKLVPIEEKDAA
ncbi:MAG: hypothetical protein CL489_10335 [Acidobacteria bacterium]|nr:hypothetical protein [Acidobacteriota bacterium]|tara:strand:+ start:12606 stop:13655 length:1050 start_codon:yes stop_codon:yes gene_type:complete